MKMTMMNKEMTIGQYLDKIIPEPWCELHFRTDYELLIAIVLSAQTTDKRVNQVTEVLFSTYPDLESLGNADVSSIESILKSLGSFRKKAIYVQSIARLLCEKYEGKVPTDREILESFPGVGRKTVSVFLSEFYDIPAFAVDTHVERVSKRLGLASSSDNVLLVEEKLKRKFRREEWARRHKQFVLFGRYYCKSVKPSCEGCELRGICKEK